MPIALWDDWLGRKATRRLQRWILPDLRWNQEIWGETVRRYLDGPVRWLDAGCGWRLLGKDLEPLESELVGLAGPWLASILISHISASISTLPGASAHL
jgi:hypothetical protein